MSNAKSLQSDSFSLCEIFARPTSFLNLNSNCKKMLPYNPHSNVCFFATPHLNPIPPPDLLGLPLTLNHPASPDPIPTLLPPEPTTKRIATAPATPQTLIRFRYGECEWRGRVWFSWDSFGGWFRWGQGWDWFRWGMAGVKLQRGKY